MASPFPGMDPYLEGDLWQEFHQTLATRRWRTSVWAMALSERMPIVPVPLLQPDADVKLDLQAAMNASFDLVGYDRLIDYRQPPLEPALSVAGLNRIDTMLKKTGARA